MQQDIGASASGRIGRCPAPSVANIVRRIRVAGQGFCLTNNPSQVTGVQVKHVPLYAYRGADFFAQFFAVAIPLLGAGLIAPRLYGWLGWGGLFGVLAVLLALALGLSAEIIVTIEH